MFNRKEKLKNRKEKFRVRGILVTKRVVHNEMEGFLMGVFDRVFLRIFQMYGKAPQIPNLS